MRPCRTGATSLHPARQASRERVHRELQWTRCRDECLNEHLFVTIEEARVELERWRVDYNTAPAQHPRQTDPPRNSLKAPGTLAADSDSVRLFVAWNLGEQVRCSGPGRRHASIRSRGPARLLGLHLGPSRARSGSRDAAAVLPDPTPQWSSLGDSRQALENQGGNSGRSPWGRHTRFSYPAARGTVAAREEGRP